MAKRNRVHFRRGDDPRAMGSPRRIRRATERGKASRAMSGDPAGPSVRITPPRPKQRRGKR